MPLRPRFQLSSSPITLWNRSNKTLYSNSYLTAEVRYCPYFYLTFSSLSKTCISSFCQLTKNRHESSCLGPLWWLTKATAFSLAIFKSIYWVVTTESGNSNLFVGSVISSYPINSLSLQKRCYAISDGSIHTQWYATNTSFFFLSTFGHSQNHFAKPFV